MKEYDSILVLGPTASGKTSLAASLASALNTEIISLDSRQFYKGLDIGSGKDIQEYTVNGKQIPYHLIDVLNLEEEINLSRFVTLLEPIKSHLSQKGLRPVLCGGSGFYIEHAIKSFEYQLGYPSIALRKELEALSDMELKSRLPQLEESKNENFNRYKAIRRIEELESNQPKAFFTAFNPLIIGINPPVKTRWERIEKRLQERIKLGMIEETRELINSGVPKERLIRLGLEYKYCTLLLDGAISPSEFEEQLFAEIRRFSKRQMTYFRKLERDGYTIHWIPWSDDPSEIRSFAIQLIQSKQWPAADMFALNAKD